MPQTPFTTGKQDDLCGELQGLDVCNVRSGQGKHEKKGGKVRIELDFPPAELFPNRAKGTHWAKLYQVRSDYREGSTWLAKPQIKGWVATEGDIPLKLTFIMPDKRNRDADNCLSAAKAGLDGLADALMINDKRFWPIEIHRQFGDKHTRKLIVEIV